MATLLRVTSPHAHGPVSTPKVMQKCCWLPFPASLCSPISLASALW